MRTVKIFLDADAHIIDLDKDEFEQCNPDAPEWRCTNFDIAGETLVFAHNNEIVRCRGKNCILQEHKIEEFPLMIRMVRDPMAKQIAGMIHAEIHNIH